MKHPLPHPPMYHLVTNVYESPTHIIRKIYQLVKLFGGSQFCEKNSPVGIGPTKKETHGVSPGVMLKHNLIYE